MIYLFPTFPMRERTFDGQQLPGFLEIQDHWTAQATKVVELDFECLSAPPPDESEAAQQFALQAHYACIIESVAMAQWLETAAGPCTCAVPYSMGLFAAVAHARAIDFQPVLALVREICAAAHQTATSSTWAVGAVVDLALPRVRELMAQASPDLEVTDRYGANTVLFTGLREPVTTVLDQALAEGASSTRLIPITAPFHTTALRAIEPAITAALERTRVRAPAWPILSSITQELLRTEDDIRAEICRNVCRPMNWFATLQIALARPEKEMVESGASLALTELARDLFPGAGRYRDFRDLQAVNG